MNHLFLNVSPEADRTGGMESPIVEPCNPVYCWMPDLENVECGVKTLFDGMLYSYPIPTHPALILFSN